MVDATYTTEVFMADLTKAVARAKKAGIGAFELAQVTMGFAHAVWDECYGENGNIEGVQAVAAQHKSFKDIGRALADGGWLTPDEAEAFNLNPVDIN